MPEKTTEPAPTAEACRLDRPVSRLVPERKEIGMGLAAELMHGVSGQAGFVALYARICDDMERDQAAWIAALRAAGVKAAHPDDGWVNRKDNYVQFVYPQFNDGAKAGDLVALGWPQWHSEKPQHRIVRLVEFHRSVFGSGSWKFEPANVRANARRPAAQE